MSSDRPVIITSFIVPLCFLLEILEYFFPEFLFQAIAVKSEQAFQAVPGTEQRGQKSTSSLWLRETEVGDWVEGREFYPRTKGQWQFPLWLFFWYFCKARTSLTNKMRFKNIFTYRRKNLRSVSTELVMVNKLQDFVEFRTDYRSGNAAQSAIHLHSTIIYWFLVLIYTHCYFKGLQKVRCSTKNVHCRCMSTLQSLKGMVRPQEKIPVVFFCIL